MVIGIVYAWLQSLSVSPFGKRMKKPPAPEGTDG
jgi:hypothetical protein